MSVWNAVRKMGLGTAGIAGIGVGAAKGVGTYGAGLLSLGMSMFEKVPGGYGAALKQGRVIPLKMKAGLGTVVVGGAAAAGIGAGKYSDRTDVVYDGYSQAGIPNTISRMSSPNPVPDSNADGKLVFAMKNLDGDIARATFGRGGV